jgi:phospholipid/cholesterol/gamma-HCH transport system permease protein
MAIAAFPPKPTRLAQRVARPFWRRAVGLGTFALFAGQVLLRALTDVVLRLRYRTTVLRHVSDVVAGAGAVVVGGGMVFVVGAMALAVGATVGVQAVAGLSQLGAESYIGIVGALANTREITPLIAGVALSAQVGASFTAEIGAMRISDEIDALEVMSVPSRPYLVATRVTAALIAIVPLYLISLFASFFATKVVTTQFFGLSPGVYDYYFRLYLPPIDVLFSLIKAMTFATVVALIHCYYGFNASGGPAGVGVAVGRAIRLSIVSVVVLNFILSLVFWGGGNTVSLSG